MTRFHLLTGSIAVVCLFVAGCRSDSGSNDIGGRYVPQGQGLFGSMTFKDGGKVDIESAGAQQEGTYTVDAEQALIVTAANGDKSRWIVESDGCLTNSVVGRYCKR
jgi:hypothetical protein